jgi:hypothetical protein
MCLNRLKEIDAGTDFLIGVGARAPSVADGGASGHDTKRALQATLWNFFS